jgi:hypothetical protein
MRKLLKAVFSLGAVLALLFQFGVVQPKSEAMACCNPNCGRLMVNTFELMMGYCNGGPTIVLCCDYTGDPADTCDFCSYPECDGNP